MKKSAMIDVFITTKKIRDIILTRTEVETQSEINYLLSEIEDICKKEVRKK